MYSSKKLKFPGKGIPILSYSSPRSVFQNSTFHSLHCRIRYFQILMLEFVFWNFLHQRFYFRICIPEFVFQNWWLRVVFSGFAFLDLYFKMLWFGICRSEFIFQNSHTGQAMLGTGKVPKLSNSRDRKRTTENKHKNKHTKGAEVIPGISLWNSHFNSIYPTKFPASAGWDWLNLVWSGKKPNSKLLAISPQFSQPFLHFQVDFWY